MKKLLLSTIFFSIFTTFCFGQCSNNQIELRKNRQRDWVKNYDDLVKIYGKRKEKIYLLKKYFYVKEKSKTCISLDSLKMLQADLETVFKITTNPDKKVSDLKGAINTVVSRNDNPQQNTVQNEIDSVESEEKAAVEVSSHQLEQSNERINYLKKGKSLWLWISIIASIGFIGTALLYLFDRRWLKEQIALKDKHYNKSRGESFDFETNAIQIWRDKYTILQEEKDNLEKEYNDFKNNLNKSNVEKLEDKEVFLPQNVAKIATKEVFSKQFYLSVPTPTDDGLGIFKDMRQVQANPTSSFYRFELEPDETKAKFWFLDNPNTIQSAIIYPETYINPVCDYEGFNSNAKNIVTKIPGIAVKVGDTWKVLTKAKIRFE